MEALRAFIPLTTIPLTASRYFFPFGFFAVCAFYAVKSPRSNPFRPAIKLGGPRSISFNRCAPERL
jgi:hypothetical protein